MVLMAGATLRGHRLGEWACFRQLLLNVMSGAGNIYIEKLDATNSSTVSVLFQWPNSMFTRIVRVMGVRVRLGDARASSSCLVSDPNGGAFVSQAMCLKANVNMLLAMQWDGFAGAGCPRTGKLPTSYRSLAERRLEYLPAMELS